MARPIVMKILPFDADKPCEISLSWSGGRAHANRILIYDNETNDLVFDDVAETFALQHTIPAHTLTNGKRYVIQARTYDAEGTASPLSDKVLFQTLETPDFHFDNVPENGRVENASLAVSVSYHSPDSEKISTYKFHLYDSTQKLLLESDALTDASDLSYVYRGLESNAAYYIRCLGVTVNGMELDTGFVGINVRYGTPNTYSRIYTTALPSRGCVQVSTNLIIVQYNGKETFAYEDGKINLMGKTLYYDEGFQIEDDCTVIIRGTNLWQTADLFQMKNGAGELALSSRIYCDGKLRFRLLVPNGVNRYVLYSEALTFDSQDVVTVSIRRKNNVYQLSAHVTLHDATADNTLTGEA